MEQCPSCGCQFVSDIPENSLQEKCPNCGEWGIVLLSSLNKKVCFSCHASFDAKLKKGQKSILIKNLVGK